MLDVQSIARTIDQFNGLEIVHPRSISKEDIQSVVDFLLQNQNKIGSNQGTFKLSASDYTLSLFTGEKLQTKLAVKNILTHEATRILKVSGVKNTNVILAIGLAEHWMFNSCYATEFCTIGECKHQSIGFLRYLAINGGIKHNPLRILSYIKLLEKNRGNNDRWEGYPFYYTLLTLSEIDHPYAIREINALKSTIKRNLKRIKNKEDLYSQRQKIILRKALRVCHPSLEQFLTINK